MSEVAATENGRSYLIHSESLCTINFTNLLQKLFLRKKTLAREKLPNVVLE